MSVRIPTLTALVLAAALPSSAQEAPGRLTGRVTDGSGGALPGVTISVTSPRLPAPVVVVSDGSGQYLSPPLPPDSYTVTFELASFEARTQSGVAVRSGDVVILDRQLSVASVLEVVEVVGAAPPPPPAPGRVHTPPRPKPQVTPVPRELLASVCGPAQPAGENRAVAKILGLREGPPREILGPGDVLVVDTGADFGVTPGQNYVVRRRFRTGDRGVVMKKATFGEHTAALVQVVEAAPDSATAVVVYACGEFYAGDTLEPFEPLPVIATQAGQPPRYDDPARIIFGDHDQHLASAGQLLVIDRGEAQGLTRGERVTIFRRTLGGDGPVRPVGDAVVVAVRGASATIRIERVSDVVTVGDMVALHGEHVAVPVPDAAPAAAPEDDRPLWRKLLRIGGQ
jgi:hypothetical protein